MKWTKFPILYLPKKISNQIFKLDRFTPFLNYPGSQEYVSKRLKDGEIGYIDGVRIVYERCIPKNI